jgi:hypothetical protein
MSLALVAAATTTLGVGLSARVGATADSIQYLFAARSLVDGAGLREIDGSPFVQYAPLFPLAVAGVSLAGLDTVSAARVVAVFSLVCAGLIAGLWTRRLTADPWSVTLGAMAGIAPIPMLLTRFVWSENLFIVLVLAAGFATTKGLQRRSTAWLLAAGALTGLAVATRWAALPLLAVGLYVGWASEVGRRSRAAAAFLLPSAAFVAVLLTRNLLVAGELVPSPAGEGVGVSDAVAQALTGLSATLVPASAPALLRFGTTVVAVATLALAVWTLRGRRDATWWRISCVPFVFAAIYILSTTVSASMRLLDRLGDRLLIPSVPLLAVGVTSIVWSAVASRDWQRLTAGSRLVGHWVALVVPIVVLWSLAAAASLRYETASQPRDRLSSDVTTSEVLLAARTLTEGPLASNDYIDGAWVIGRPVARSPRDEGELDQFARASTKHPIALVWSDHGEPGGLTLDQIRQRCTITPIERVADGQLLEVGPCEVP